MAIKTFRVASTTSNNTGDLIDGVDQTAATRTDGWTSAKIGTVLASDFDAATKQTSGTFVTASTRPSALTAGSTANALGTMAPLSGTFANTAWTFTFAVRATTASSQAGRMRMRVYRSKNADGSAATEITGATQVGTTSSTLSTSADVTSVVTWSPGTTITLSNEYLFFSLAWEITTAGGSNSADVQIRTGQSAAGSRLVTPDFVPTPNTPITLAATAVFTGGTSTQDYATTILADTPKAYYRLGDASGSLVDSSGNGYDAILNATAPTYGANGLIVNDSDKALSLVGAGYFTNASVPDRISDISIEAWVVHNNIAAATRRIASRGTSAGWSAGVNATGFWRFTTLGVKDYDFTASPLRDGATPYHVVFVWRAATFAVDLYINGSLSQTVTGAAAMLTSTDPLEIAGRLNIEGWNGILDEVAFYWSALTPAQIANHYAAGKKVASMLARKAIYKRTLASSAVLTPNLTKIQPVRSKIEVLTDSFDTTLDKAVKWNNSSAAVVWDASARTKIPCTTSYWQLASNTGYDLTGSYFLAQVTPPPVGTGTRETFMELLCNAGGTDKVHMYVSGTGLTARRVINSVVSGTFTAAYNATNHVWWKIRESGGTIFFDTSPDGTNWTNFYSVATSGITITNARPNIDCGYYGTETAADAFIDNVNLPPGAVPNAVVLQSKSTSGKSTTLDIIWNNNCVIGSTLFAVCYWDNTSATCTVADPNNGNWTPIGSPQNGAGALAGYRCQMFSKFNNVVAAKPLVIGTISQTFSDGGICLIELSAGRTVIESSIYGTSAAANPSQSLTPNIAGDAMIAFEFCESSPGSSAGSGWTIVESANFASNPVAVRTSVTPGSANTAAWISPTQQTILGMAVIGAPVANPKLETFTDSFDASLDLTKWDDSRYATWDSVGKQAAIDCAGNGWPNAGYISPNETNPAHVYDLTGSYFMGKITVPPNVNSSEVDMNVYVANGLGTSRVQIAWFSNALEAYYQAAGAWSSALGHVTYDSVAHAWWRIREASGRIYFDTSPDGRAWTNLANIATPIAINNVYGDFESFNSGTSSVGTAYVDNVNVIPSLNTPITIGATVTLTPALTETEVYKRTIGATATLTAALGRTAVYKRAVAATSVFTPTLNRQPFFGRVFPASSALVPGLSRKLLASRTIAAASTLTPGLVKSLFAPRLVNATTTLIPGLAIQKSKGFSFPLTATFTPSLARFLKSSRTLSVTPVLTPVITRMLQGFRTFALAPSFSSTVTVKSQRLISFFTGVVFTPDMTKVRSAAGRLVSLDAVTTLIPALAKISKFSRTQAVTTTLTPAISRVPFLNRIFAVTANFTVTQARKLSALRTLSTATSFSPSLTARSLLGRSLAASVSLSLALSRFLKVGRNLSTSVSMNPSLDVGSGKNKIFNATVTFAVAVKRFIAMRMDFALNFIPKIQRKSTTTMALSASMNPDLSRKALLNRIFASVTVIQAGLQKGSGVRISLSAALSFSVAMIVGRVNRVILSVSAIFRAALDFLRFVSRPTEDTLFSTTLDPAQLLAVGDPQESEIESATLEDDEIAALLSAASEIPELGQVGEDIPGLRSVS